MGLRLSEKELATLLNKGVYIPDTSTKGETSKYRNKKTEYDGKKFDSVKEKERYIELCFMQRAGLIADLKCQVKFELIGRVKFAYEKKIKRATNYIADFTYIDIGTGLLVVEDVKSKKTSQLPAYRLKKTLMKANLNLDVMEIIY